LIVGKSGGDSINKPTIGSNIIINMKMTEQQQQLKQQHIF
jgi:hypothetical protein